MCTEKALRTSRRKRPWIAAARELLCIAMLLWPASIVLGQTPANPPQPTPPTSAQDSSSASTGQATKADTKTKSDQKPNTPAEGQKAQTPPATAQPPRLPVEGTFDEVHIRPRKEPGMVEGKPVPDVPTPSELDPSLKTYSKPIKVDVDLVLVPVTVTDPMNRLVTGLDKGNFSVWDNGRKQEISSFASQDAPISLGVIFDMSGSMADKIDKAKEAVVEFLKTANPQDEFFLVAFNDKPELVSDFTQSVSKVQGQLVYAIPKGRTALMDAIYMGLAKMREARHQRKALLIISDGGDNHSRYTESEILSLVKEADVQIYAIGLFSQNPGTPEEQMGPATLSAITDVTGGRTFTIDNPNDLSDVATKIGIELRNQYVLGYRPTDPVRDGKWRKIRVKLNPPKGLPPLTVYAKSGYYAPNQ